MTDAVLSCCCSSGLLFAQCCGQYTQGGAVPQTAEKLMRSRYSAYVLRDTDYLTATWHPSTRPANLFLDPEVHWIGLEIKKTTAGKETDHTGSVEFIARYKINGRAYRLHETSRFIRQGIQWFYLDGVSD